MRKIYTLLAGLAVLISFPTFSQHAFLEQGLIDMLDSTDDGELIPIMFLVENAVDMGALKEEFRINQTPVSERPKIVMQRLKTAARENQPQVISAIRNSGYAYDNLQEFWLANAISLEAEPALIEVLANHSAIEHIGLNMPEYALQKPTRGSGDAKIEGGNEPGLEAIGAPFMWAMGYTGHGRVAMTFDTGVVTDHPALQERYLANLMPIQSTWFGYDSELPTDKPSSHGTHVTGIMLGLDDATADTIGVAPEAYFIATDPIVSNLADIKPLSELMLAYEWALNPDGDESTTNDIPDVINNSWGRDNSVIDQGWTVCPELVVPFLDAVLAAGIANVFSAGNEGPDAETIGVPHNINTGLVNSFTVAATSATGSHTVADFSSRGPSLCGGEGSILIKPEVAAPGVNIRSAIGGGDYDFFSGTSMAAPHTSGAVLLLKEAFPMVTGEEIQLALYNTALDLGIPGEDNTYGMGFISIPDAYDYLSETYEPVPPAVLVNDLAITAITSPNLDFGCSPDGNTTVVPVIEVTNFGTTAIDEFTVRYDINGEGEVEMDFSQTIAVGETVEITLSEISTSTQGLAELHIRIDELDEEYDLWNNHRVTRWYQLPNFEDDLLTFGETFDNGIDPDLWIVSNPDGEITWDTINAIQIDDQVGPTAWMNHPDYSNINSQKDQLVSPVFDSESFNGTLFVVLDYFYRKRGNNSFTQDTMSVYVNQGCSEDQQLLWTAGGEELWTNSDGEQNAFPESSSDWNTLALPFEVEESSFYFTIETKNRRGNNILVDNIYVATHVGVRDQGPDVKFSVFPNPSSGEITIIPNEAQEVTSISIRDIQGRTIEQITGYQQAYQLNLNVESGVYLITLNYASGQTSTQKLVLHE